MTLVITGAGLREAGLLETTWGLRVAARGLRLESTWGLRVAARRLRLESTWGLRVAARGLRLEVTWRLRVAARRLREPARALPLLLRLLGLRLRGLLYQVDVVLPLVLLEVGKHLSNPRLVIGGRAPGALGKHGNAETAQECVGPALCRQVIQLGHSLISLLRERGSLRLHPVHQSHAGHLRVRDLSELRTPAIRPRPSRRA